MSAETSGYKGARSIPLFPMHPPKNRKQVTDQCPSFSSSATKTGPCTRIAAGTGRARLMGVGIYPVPLVFWGSCPVACPGVGVLGQASNACQHLMLVDMHQGRTNSQPTVESVKLFQGALGSVEFRLAGCKRWLAATFRFMIFTRRHLPPACWIRRRWPNTSHLREIRWEPV